MKVRFCYKYESRNVGVKITALTARGKPAEWHGKDCSFHNTVFPEKEDENGK